jgi:pimeloyl-ACP methyl ester carboxylesterase
VDRAREAAIVTVRHFLHDGATLVAEEQGSGPRTFVLIHGIGMGRTVFAGLTEQLLPHGRVVAVDLPGYGEAPEPPRTPTMERNADVVAAYLRHRGFDAPVLIGHSMGTQVVVEIAARHPRDAGPAVLIGPTVNPAERTALCQLARLAQDLLVESPRVIIAGAREYLRSGPHLRRKMRAMLVHRPERTYPRVRVPALVLRGEHDRVVSREWALEVVRLLPEASFAEVEGHGHETMIRDAGAAARAILAEF